MSHNLWYNYRGQVRDTTVGEMVDSEARSAPGEQWDIVQRLTARLPELTKSRTEAELGNILSDSGIVINGTPAQPIEPAPAQATPPAAPMVVDLYAEQKAARDRVNILARRVTRKRRGVTTIDEAFGEMMKTVFGQHKRRLGFGDKELKALGVEELKKLAASLAQELGGEHGA